MSEQFNPTKQLKECATHDWRDDVECVYDKARGIAHFTVTCNMCAADETVTAPVELKSSPPHLRRGHWRPVAR